MTVDESVSLITNRENAVAENIEAIREWCRWKQTQNFEKLSTRDLNRERANDACSNFNGVNIHM